MTSIKNILGTILSTNLLRFVLIGGGATTIDFCIYMLFRQYVDYSVAKFVSMACANVFSFIFNRKWVFKDNRQVKLNLIYRYLSVQIVNIMINVGMNKLCILLTSMIIPSFVIATGIATVANYLGQKYFVFKNKTVQV